MISKLQQTNMNARRGGENPPSSFKRKEEKRLIRKESLTKKRINQKKKRKINKKKILKKRLDILNREWYTKEKGKLNKRKKIWLYIVKSHTVK